MTLLFLPLQCLQLVLDRELDQHFCLICSVMEQNLHCLVVAGMKTTTTVEMLQELNANVNYVQELMSVQKWPFCFLEKLQAVAFQIEETKQRMRKLYICS